MAPHITGRTRPTKPKKQERAQKRKRDDVSAEKLEQAVRDLVCLIRHNHSYNIKQKKKHAN